MKKILVTGATGQIGTDLCEELRNIYGEENVISSARNEKPKITDQGIFHKLDCTDSKSFYEIAKKYNVDTILHLAAILSAVGE